MDESDVGRAGLAALAGAATALGPAAAPVALLLLTLDQLLALEGGAPDAAAPTLTGDEIKGIIQIELLYQDVRKAWSNIAVAFDLHSSWVQRAKHGEVFTDADKDDVYRALPGKIDAVKCGINLLYSGKPTRAASPSQYGLPYLITGVGVLVHLRECVLVRVIERGEEVSVESCGTPSSSCRVALPRSRSVTGWHVSTSMRPCARSEHPEFGPDGPQVAKKAQLLETVLLGGDLSRGTTAMPAMVALRDIYSMMSGLDEEMDRRS